MPTFSHMFIDKKVPCDGEYCSASGRYLVMEKLKNIESQGPCYVPSVFPFVLRKIEKVKRIAKDSY